MTKPLPNFGLSDPLACDVYRFNGEWSGQPRRSLSLHNWCFRPVATLRWVQSSH